MHIHLDGDIVKYRAGFAAQRMHYYLGDREFESKQEMDDWAKAHGLEKGEFEFKKERVLEPVANALHNAKSIIMGLQEFLGVKSDLTVYLSGEGNFRKNVGDVIYRDHPNPGYKANRKDDEPPAHAEAIVDYLIKNYNTQVTEGEEADDAIGISHCFMKRDSIIASTDKDLNMLPGWHLNFVKEDQYFVSEEEAMICFWRQLLTGDPTDNIPGLYRLGAKTAAKHINAAMSYEQCYAKALELYTKQYGELGEQALLENARMIWIRREPEQLWEYGVGK
jgi:hypothetical protein